MLIMMTMTMMMIIFLYSYCRYCPLLSFCWKAMGQCCFICSLQNKQMYLLIFILSPGLIDGDSMHEGKKKHEGFVSSNL